MNAENGHRLTDVPPETSGLIERERRQLQRASTVLTCLTVAAMYDDEIDAGDVAQVVRSLIDDVIDALDIVNLKRAAEAPDGSGEPDGDAP